MLLVERRAKHFGSVVATDDVALSVEPGGLHAVIGLDGAAKTTPIARHCGQLLARESAREALARVVLAARAEWSVSRLSHGERCQLECPMALAGRPRLLLLDESIAGLGQEESVHIVEMLRGLKGEVSILLVEHNMEAVFALADRVTVPVSGRAIASGRPVEIRASESVRHTYLGEEAANG
jgi:branched-chain amino acid transport system ATP-binding protein